MRKYLKVEQISESYTVRDGKGFQKPFSLIPSLYDVERRHKEWPGAVHQGRPKNHYPLVTRAVGYKVWV